jgi:UDP-N-acetylmuramoyl-tripeptide--D-alanyl-D-alanine ligase
MRWTDAAVRTALSLGEGDESVQFTRIATDSRTVSPGDLFVALSGERFDGHQFLEPARVAGAIGAVVRAGTPEVSGLRLYRVEDPLRALGWLARHRRRSVTGPVVAVTGTNGKTSTKEMLAGVLATRYRTHATRSNLNNLVGVPQTILEAPDDTEALVVEAGANLPGEIGRYREIIEPSITVITNVAPGHLEGFGSLEAVLTEKVSLALAVPLAVVGTEPAALRERAEPLAGRVVTAGLERADVVPTSVTVLADGRTHVTIDEVGFTVSQLGLHQVRNAVLAWAVGRELGLDRSAVAVALETVTIPGGRGDLSRHGDLTILNDSYNANPASFRAAIELAATLRSGRPLVFVAGTMRELGPDSAKLHQEIADRLIDLDPDLIGAVGEFVPALDRYAERLGDRLLTAPDAVTMGKRLAPRLKGSELVVIKGSRGVALERLLPDLVAAATRPAH